MIAPGVEEIDTVHGSEPGERTTRADGYSMSDSAGQRKGDVLVGRCAVADHLRKAHRAGSIELL
jgi:hypothetical protein